MYAAVRHGHVLVVRQILSYMAWTGITPHGSCSRCRIDGACNGARRDAGTARRPAGVGALDRLLEVAAASGDTELAELLIDGGWPVDGAEGDLSPLRAACRACDDAMVSLLLRRGARVAVPPRFALHMCPCGDRGGPGRSLSASGCVNQWSVPAAAGAGPAVSTEGPPLAMLLQPCSQRRQQTQQGAVVDGAEQAGGDGTDPAAAVWRRRPRRCLSASHLPPAALPEPTGAPLPTSALHFVDCPGMVRLLLTCRPELRAQVGTHKMHTFASNTVALHSYLGS